LIKIPIILQYSYIILKFRTKKYIHGKNDFSEILKNLTRYKSENNFDRPK